MGSLKMFSLSQQSEFSFSAIKRAMLGVSFRFFRFKSCLKVTPVCEGTRYRLKQSPHLFETKVIPSIHQKAI